MSVWRALKFMRMQGKYTLAAVINYAITLTAYNLDSLTNIIFFVVRCMFSSNIYVRFCSFYVCHFLSAITFRACFCSSLAIILSFYLKTEVNFSKTISKIARLNILMLLDCCFACLLSRAQLMI